jgi:hypothetical protein
MVKEWVPAAAVLAATIERVAEPDPVMAPVVEAVTPAGKPVKLRATGDAKPGVPATLTVAVPVAPATTVRDAGLTVIEKVGVTVSASVAVLVTPPPTAVMVRGWVPAAALAPAATVKATEVGVGAPADIETPAGTPAMLTVTAEVKLLLGAIVRVNPALAPAATLRVLGLTVNENVGAGVTVSATVAVLVTPAPAAVTVAA